MNIALNPESDRLLEQQLASGRYTSANEVIEEALHLLEEQTQTRAAQLEAFNRELERRIASLDRGEYVDPETVWASIRRMSEEHRQQQP